MLTETEFARFDDLLRNLDHYVNERTCGPSIQVREHSTFCKMPVFAT